MSEHEHRWTTTFYGDWVCGVEGCYEALSYTLVKNILNEHATLKRENKRLNEYADEGWAWVDEFCKLSETDVFGLRALLTAEESG